MKFNKTSYRRTILLLKIITKLVVLALISSVIIFIVRRNSTQESRKNTTETLKQYEIAVENSTFDGIDKNGKKYSVNSKLLLKTGENLYRMQRISGLYDKTGLDVKIDAKYGFMDDESKLLKLEDDVVIQYDGITLYTDQADIDMNGMIAQNNVPVSVLFSHSNITSDRFKADGNTGVLQFKGNVKANFKMSDF